MAATTKPQHYVKAMKAILASNQPDAEKLEALRIELNVLEKVLSK